MSLLDDVSIVVTPNGYKAGELYAVVPVPVEGAELVTDSDFLLTGTQAENTTGTYWTTRDSWSISGGNATLDGTQAGGSSLISNLFTVEAGRMYKVTVNVSSTSSGFRLYDTIGVVDYGLDVGENTFYRIPSSSTSSFNVTVLGLAGTTGEVSSVSVKEYTSADMDVTRATAATRVDENGLVNYAEVLGDEELTDGGFPTGTSAWYEGTGWSLGNGYAESDGTNAPLDQYNALEIGKQYIVVITVTGMTASPLSVRLGTSSSDQVLQITSDGTYTAYGTAGSTTFRLRSQGFNGKVTNVSVKEVTRDNVPRIDYTGGGCPHILAEPMRTNIVFPSDVAVTQTRTVTAVEYALSFYGTGSIVLSGTHSATLTGTGVNDRVDLIFTPTAGSLVLTVSGTVTNFQLEVGSYATSLIPTVSGIVTRNQDIFTRDGIGSLINSPEGVLFVEMAALSDDSTRRVISLSDGTNTNRVVLRYDNASNRVQGFIQVSGATNGNINDNSYTITNFLKIAYKWKAGDFALWINGTEVATSTDATSFGAGVLTEMQFNEGDGAGSEYFGKVKQLQVYDTALTDTQLAALTS